VNKEEIRDKLYNAVMSHMRKELPKEIESAYDFFWEEEYPDEFLSGMPLELAFMNFEDWLVCDYRYPDGTTAIEMFKLKNEVDKDSDDMLSSMRDSFISLYEVISIEDGLGLRDLVLEEEIDFPRNPLPQLEKGSVFAARLIESEGEYLLGRCVYPFTKDVLDDIMDAIDKGFRRYKKHNNPEGERRQFLKDESYTFNTIWISNLFRRSD
jgi:hypothetical protein